MEIDLQSAARQKVVGVSLDVVDAYHLMDIKKGTYAILGLSPDFRRLGSDPTNQNHIPLVYGFVKPGKHADPKHDRLFLHFAEKAVKDQNLVPMPNPGGLSGGGIWSVPLVKKNQVWSPHKYRLAGITTHFFEISRQIRGLRMHHWLKLLLVDHPELSQHVEPLLNQSA